MGKISKALVKHKKEWKATAKKQKLQPVDYEILMQFDQTTGKLDLKRPRITQDSEIVDRLLTYRLIDSDGNLTPAGKDKCTELNRQETKKTAIKPISLSGNEAHRSKAAPGNETREDVKAVIEADMQIPTTPVVLEKLTKAERDVLRQYDKATEKLGVTMQNRAIVQQLQHRGLILDDGKLATNALKLCRELESKAIKESENTFSNTGNTAGISEEQVGNESDSKPELDLLFVASAATEKVTQFKPEEPSKSEETEKKSLAVRDPASEPSFPPSNHERMDPSLISLFNPQSFEAEQFKILRSNLLYPLSGNPPRSVMVTSPLPGEGKSFVASNLAISVALNINRHVLLIDCDLRRPSINTRFGIENGPGLTDYLSNETSLSDLLIRTSIQKLTILPGGKPPENPSELLSSEGMSRLLKEVTERYHDRLIILDSPPPSMTAESSVLARWVDGVIIVINHGRTPLEGVSDVLDRVGRDKIIGAIVNNFEVHSSRYYGNYYGKK